MAAYVHVLAFICIFNVFLQSLAFGKTPTISYEKAFRALYGDNNVVPYDNNSSVQIAMDETSSSGFRSTSMYMHGYFGASIKLPKNYTAGVIVTLYTSNNEEYPFRHDEIDFEFLGHVHGQPWTVQTNFYGNGSTSKGREERYIMWFDPSEAFHHYGILWQNNMIVYYVDDVPIREVKRVDAMGSDFPSMPMALYGTIWNGSDWATNGGRDKLKIEYGPYIASYSDFVLTDGNVSSIDDFEITDLERHKMRLFREEYMTYSYCDDSKRYVVPLPECEQGSSE